MMNATRLTIPISAWLLAIPGLACLAGGFALLVGDFGALHPVLAEPGAGIALVVSAVALLGSAAFPVVLRRLAERDAPPPA